MHTHHRGFIGAGILIVLGLLILQFAFDVNVFGWLKSPSVVHVLSYLKKLIFIIWRYIEMPFMWIWSDLIVDGVWKYIVLGWDVLTAWIDTQ